MAEKILDRATLLAIIGLILLVWSQLSNRIDENANAVYQAEVKILEEIRGVDKAIANVATDVAVVKTIVEPLVPEIQATIRNTYSNKEEINELRRRILDLEEGDP